MTNPKRIAIVGVGSIGKRHAVLLRERSDVAVELVEPNAGVLAAAQNELGSLPVHRSFEAMLNNPPAAVWLATPTALHAEQALQALKSGCHVFCEKPMTDSVADAIRLIETVAKTKKVLNVGFHLHFHPILLRVKQLIEERTLGQILHLHARVGTYATLASSVSRHQAVKPGSLIWDYAHQPDVFWWLLKTMPTHVYAVGFRGGDLELTSNPNVLAITLTYEKLLVATIHLNYVQSPERHEYEVVADRGWVLADINSGTIRIGLPSEKQVRVETHAVPRDDLYRAEHESFLQAIAGQREPETSAWQGLASVAICESIQKAWQAGGVVKLGALPESFSPAAGWSWPK